MLSRPRMQFALAVLSIEAARIAKTTAPTLRKAIGIEFDGPVVAGHNVIMICTFATKNAIDHIGDLNDIKSIPILVELNGPSIQEHVMIGHNIYLIDELCRLLPIWFPQSHC